MRVVLYSVSVFAFPVFFNAVRACDEALSARCDIGEVTAAPPPPPPPPISVVLKPIQGIGTHAHWSAN